MNKFVIIFSIWNVIVMLVYGIDKLKAKMGAKRISEKALLLCAVLLGGWGAILAMVLFNHKTSKIKFRILVPAAAVVCAVVIYLVSVYNDKLHII